MSFDKHCKETKHYVLTDKLLSASLRLARLDGSARGGNSERFNKDGLTNLDERDIADLRQLMSVVPERDFKIKKPVRGENIMAHSDERLEQIFDRTSGYCHICGGKLSFCNYAAYGARSAWEVEHSKPKCEGGTDHLNNLYAAHVSCNRSERAAYIRTARAKYGRTKAPLSSKRRAKAKSGDAADGAFIGGTLRALIGGLWSELSKP